METGPRQPWSAESRAIVLDAQLDATRLRGRLVDGARVVDREELVRLRVMIAAQESEMASLREELRRLRAERRSTSVEQLAVALAAALRTGEAAMADRVIAAAHVELKAALQISDGEVGIFVSGPDPTWAQQAGTLSFDLRRLPPTLAEEMLRVARAEVAGAAATLQRALERTFADDAAQAAGQALARSSELAAAGAAEVTALVAPLARALVALAAYVPELSAPAEALERSAAALSAAPTADALFDVAAALREIAAALA